MIDCAKEIVQFVSSSNPAEVYRGAKTKVTEAGVTTIQTFPNFTLDTGRRIDRPYIRLERREGYWHPGIGMGRVKARAFLHFETQIRKWAAAGNYGAVLRPPLLERHKGCEVWVYPVRHAGRK